MRRSYIHKDLHEGMFAALESQLEALYEDLLGRACADACELHLRQLGELRPYLSKVRTHKTCLSCVTRTPEKVLSCGHALCDACVRCFGQRCKDDKYTFAILMCPLCGIRNDRASVQLEPPTAGIRILSLDGGGVRGIIPLVFLRRIEERLQELEMPLSENFDLVCGTSAGETSSVTGLSLPYEKLTLDTGGLITIGLFLMQWNVDECLTKFETLAEKTFRRRNGYTVFGRIQELAMSYFRDGQYSSLAIEESFQSVFGDDMKMFNPLCNNTKVAVTTTTAKDARPCLFSNYNGGIRPPSIGESSLLFDVWTSEILIRSGYDIIRASRPEDDVCLREAYVSIPRE